MRDWNRLDSGATVRRRNGPAGRDQNIPSILVVEDDDDLRDLLATFLRTSGLAAESCRSATEALHMLRRRPFDLILTDYELPGRTGGWLLRQASAEGLLDSTPALVVTAHPDPAEVSEFEILEKPFDLDDLVTLVRRRLGPRDVASLAG
jgi:DNA-binding NtrC family response regulator